MVARSLKNSPVENLLLVVAPRREHATQSNQAVYLSVSGDGFFISLLELALFSRTLRVEEGKAAEYLIS
jgi:hypothetical protein